jgi:hypothetical protein
VFAFGNPCKVGRANGRTAYLVDSRPQIADGNEGHARLCDVHQRLNFGSLHLGELFWTVGTRLKEGVGKGLDLCHKMENFHAWVLLSTYVMETLRCN